MMETLNQYIIKRETMALLPHDAEDGSLHAIVVEEARMLEVLLSPLKIVQNSCNYFGSTYKGRKKGAACLGFRSMPPICICNELGIYFYPLMSESQRGCIWIGHSHVNNWEDGGQKDVLVHMTHDQSLRLPVPVSVFRNKTMRTTQFRHQIRLRISPYQMMETGALVREDGPQLHIQFNERGTFSLKTDQEMQMR
jgi:competence protein ComK